jgi:hypothetical protein
VKQGESIGGSDPTPPFGMGRAAHRPCWAARPESPSPARCEPLESDGLMSQSKPMDAVTQRFHTEDV